MTATYTELRQQMIDGDTTITAAQLDKARREEEFANLQHEAGQAAEARRAEAERLAALAELEAQARALADKDLGELQAHYRQAVESIRALRSGVREYNREQQRLTSELRKVALETDEIDWRIPEPINLEFEQERLISEAKSTKIPWNASRLHDDETRAAIKEARGR